jgi:hypothetical protein
MIVKGSYKNYSPASIVCGVNVGGINAGNNILYNNVIFDNFQSYQMNGTPDPSALNSSSSIVLGDVFLASAYPTGSNIIMKDSLFYTSGSTFIRNATTNPINFITKNVISNRDLPSNVNFLDGDLTITENLNKLIY